MAMITALDQHVGSRSDKFYKTTLFQSEHILLGVNCLDPGQVQTPHEHENQDKFYYVFEGSGQFWLGQEEIQGNVGDVVWAPAGVQHGVANNGHSRLTLLVGIAPAP